MKSELRVTTPPAKPVLIFDGDCNFCTRWVYRWHQATGEVIEYIPFQDPLVSDRFPELPKDRFQTAVHLVETDGSVYYAAEAAFRALAHNPREAWLLDWYTHSQPFARGSEWFYGLVARHRTFFSFLTRIAWGKHVEQPSHLLLRWIFLRALAAVYLVAFVSLWIQISGLIGSKGILPAELTMNAVRQEFIDGKVGLDRYHLFPTLCWLGASDSSLQWQCAAGTVLALLLLIGLAPAPCLFLLWLIYLSLSTVCREFLGFQWDILLLETGFLAIFFAPWHWRPRFASGSPPSLLVLWLFRWLLFRLMFASGWVKLASGDPTWRNLTALTYHYETQPLPTWIGWYAHQLPLRFQKFSTAWMFGVELVLPFLIFLPRRLRHVPCAAFISLQCLILLTGNYCFFNLLTIALCLLLLDDAALWRLVPKRLRQAGAAPAPFSPPGRSRLPLLVSIPLAWILIVVPAMQFGGIFRLPVRWPKPLLGLYDWLTPLRSVNHYGLFAVMTTSRPEIIIEGSNDGAQWLPYEFKYKPGDLKRRPRFVEPHQPRLDWQMWFAALGDYQQNPWLVNFCLRLLQGTPEVLGLLRHNPFPDHPPRYVRAVVYEYHFTDWGTRSRTGEWWKRELKGEYMPVISLPMSSSPATTDPSH